MSPAKELKKSGLVDAVQLVYEALKPFEEADRQRILASATSLLGTKLPQVGQTTHQDLRPTQPKTDAASGRPLSPVELIQQKQPATNSQKIALFAYHREKVEGLSRFSREDLAAYFAKAKQPAPKNYDRDFRDAVKQGWIFEDGSESYLTSKGLEAVEEGFAGKGLPRGRSAQGAKRGTKKKGTPKKRSKRPRRKA